MTSASPSLRRKAGDAGLWWVLAIGLLLMLVAATLRADSATESRVERFNATLEPGSTLQVDNISGDLIAIPGREFRAFVEIRVTASTAERAKELLDGVRILQSREGSVYALDTHWSRSLLGWQGGRGRRLLSRCQDCKVTARYELTVPPGVAAHLETLNGEVRVRDLDGDLRLRAVNGLVSATGVRRSIEAQTVNGKVEAVAATLPADASVNLQTVNGAVLLTLPKDSKFRFTASTMNGAIASTFALPKSEDWIEEDAIGRPRERYRSSRVPRRIVVTDGEDGVTIVDVKQLERELEKSLREIEVGVQDSVRGVGEIRILDPRRAYQGTVGGGGARIRLSSLNGAITLLASGTREGDAQAVVPQRRSFVVTIPEIKVTLPRIRIEPKTVISIRPEPDSVSHPVHGEEEIVRGDVSGNFLSTRGGGSYKLGKVSGTVKILTDSGEIRVASAGGAADLKTRGGDIQIGPVGGALRAHTGAGDVKAASVGGFALAHTSGGDIRLGDVGGGAELRTGGGDIVLLSARGPVHAETGGGTVRVGLVSQIARGAVAIHNSGGDVSLTLPSDFRGNVELIVAGTPLADEHLVRSEFPELAVTRRQDGVYAVGAINGGGPKVVVRTSSGVIRLKKGARAQ